MQQQQLSPPDQASARTAMEVDAFEKFRVYHATRDIALRDQLVCEYLPLVNSIARRYSNMGEPVDDLIQEGSIGLMKAVDYFDPDRGVKFSTYASHLITSQIQHYLRDCGHLIRQPAWIQELNTKVSRATKELAQELGREPLTAEIAERLNLTEESILEVLAARELNHIVSLTAPADSTGDSELLLIDKEKIRSRKAETLRLPLEDRIVLEESITKLKSLEQQVVRLFFYGGLNQSEIARKLNISPHYSSYLLRRSMDKIKAEFDEQRQQETAMLQQEAAAPPHPQLDVPIYDRSTGIHSEAYLRSRLLEEVARCQRKGSHFALMMMSVRGMSAEAQDQLTTLSAIARLVRGSLRMTDVSAFLGGGRFALLLLDTGREAHVVGERLCQMIPRHPSLATLNPETLSLNMGFTVFPGDGTTAEQLFTRTEQALRASLNTGPNTVVMFSLQLLSRRS